MPFLMTSSDLMRDGHLSTLRSVLFGLSFIDFESLNYDIDHFDESFIINLINKFYNCKHCFCFNGIDYSLFYRKIINDILTCVIPDLIKYIGKVRKSIRDNHIKAVVLLDELDEKNRAVAAVCSLEGVKSIFVDHGIMGFHHAQRVCDRNRTDIVLCAGDFFRDYYMNQRLSKRQCFTLGNPSMDPYPVERRKKITRINKVLFLSFEDNYYARLDRFPYQERYLNEIFSIFKRLTSLGILIYYKPHPGERKEYTEYIFRFFNINENDIQYIDNRSFTSLIYEMDLLVCNVSTCYYESLAAGVPAIFMEPHFIHDALLPPLNSSDPEEVIRVATGEEILAIIKDNYENPDKLNHFVDQFLSKHSHKYMASLDGNAGKRIMNFLANEIGQVNVDLVETGRFECAK